MKTIKFLLFALLIQTSLLNAQEYSFLSKNLHKMSDQEMIDNQVKITADVPMYTEKGEKIDPSQINDLMGSGNFFPEIFGNIDLQVKAIIFRQATKEEKAKMVQTMNMQDPNANFVAGEMAENFTAYDIDGNKISLKSLRGKVVVLNFWFPQCKPCIMEMPKLNKLVNKYKDVVFLSITYEKKSTIKKFLINTEFNYTHITDNEPLLNSFEIMAFPTHILIDKKGEILLKKVGDYVNELDIKIGLLLK